MKQLIGIFLILFELNAFADICGDKNVLLKDQEGNVAIVIDSYDCWNRDDRQNKCYKINDIPRNQSHLHGFRSHRVLFKNKEYAFVESWRRGSPAYVSGAFPWNFHDVKNYIKISFGFTDGKDQETKFTFSSSLAPPFHSLSITPKELDGKTFKYSGCS